MNPWDHLPNAKHIDRVIASEKANFHLWQYEEEDECEYLEAERYRACESACIACGGERGEIWDRFWSVESQGAYATVLALIAYDDCAHMLDSDPGELAIIAKLGSPVAILLLPACIAFAKEKELV